MKILYVNDYYFSNTGSSISNRNLCSMLAKQGHDISVIACASSRQVDQEQFASSAGLSNHKNEVSYFLHTYNLLLIMFSFSFLLAWRFRPCTLSPRCDR